MKQAVITAFKVLFALGALYIVYIKADLREVAHYLKNSNIWLILGATLVLALAQLISALRMRFYFIHAELDVSRYFSIALYWVGMFFNTILPGGIGGDGYKILLMSKLEQLPKLTSLRLALSNRASGLFLLLLFTFILAFASHYIQQLPYSHLLLWIGIIGLIPSYFISIKVLLKETVKAALFAAKYSFIIQGCCLISAAILFSAMGLDFTNQQAVINYLLLFMISSVASILPVSIGGAGLREMTFLYGTVQMGLDKELGIAFSLIYFAINTVLSLFGLFFVSKLHTIHEKQKKVALL
jgi:glycosyltransferase 2 family protein